MICNKQVSVIVDFSVSEILSSCPTLVGFKDPAQNSLMLEVVTTFSAACSIKHVIPLMCFPLQKGLLEVLYEIFRLPVPIATQNFVEALQSVGEDQMYLYICIFILSIFSFIKGKTGKDHLVTSEYFVLRMSLFLLEPN